MIRQLTVGQGGERRVFSLDDFPLSIGGSDCHVVIPNFDSPYPVFYLGHDNDEIFIQPAEKIAAAYLPSCNGVQLTASRWLRNGDEIGTGSFRLRFHFKDDTVSLELPESAGSHAIRKPSVQIDSEPDPRHGFAERVIPVSFVPASESGTPRRSWNLRPRRIFLVAGMALLLLGAWFVFTARAVQIEVIPAPATLSVKGLLTPRLGGRYLLLPGNYSVIANKPGYLPLTAPFEIDHNTPSAIQFTLEPRGAPVTFHSSPVENAEIVVDDRTIGVTPLQGFELSAGEHRVKIRASLHLPYSTTMNIAPGGPPQTIKAELEPNWAPVTVATSPPGATVFVDGERVGVSPHTGAAEAGQHNLELRLAKYKTLRRRFEVAAEEPLDLGIIKLEPEDGFISVVTSPVGASVTVDGVFRGSTPVDLRVTPNTQHEVRISLAGHATSTRAISISPEQRSEIRINLEPLSGQISFVSKPPGAELIVDGISRGKTGQTLHLEARKHTIEVRLPGYKTFRTTIEPNPGFAQELSAELREEGPTALPKALTSPQGVELRLIGPGRFQMGASRREPGRRANEMIREVEITSGYYLSTREVSNREFREFRESHLSGGAGNQNLEIDHHPVVRVTWEDAARYCNWLSTKAGLPPVYVEKRGKLVARSPLPRGYRLPTEAEWAWAARYSGSATARKYSWGSSLPVPPKAGNFGDLSARALLGSAIPNFQDNYPATAPVGSFDANPLGIHNLGGNVAEWVHDVYAFSPPTPGTVETDPTGPPSGTHHVIRGASWMDYAVTELRLTYRDYGNQPRPDVGFRIAMSTE